MYEIVSTSHCTCISPLLNMNGTDLHNEIIKSTEHQNCSKDRAHEARTTMNLLKPKQLLCRF
jgi:hypothetical protein